MRLKDPELCKVFEAESSQRLATIETGLERLATASLTEAPELRSAILREAHTLKGAARMAGLDDIGHLAHCLEDALSEAGARASTGPTIHATLAAIRTLTREATRGRGPAPPLIVTPYEAPHEPEPLAAARRAAATHLVDAARLEEFLTLSREALDARARPDDLDRILPRLHEAARALRDVPFATIAKPLQRAAQELARVRGKDVYLLVEGGDVRVDPRALDALRGPLLHLLHNAVDHGIETPDARRAAGKIPTGLVTITASVDGEGLVIEVSDDGRGLDEASVLAAAARCASDTTRATRAEDLVFLPGLSTSVDVSETSGRGVGLDAVRSTARDLGGDVHLASSPGNGCVFRIRIPVVP